MHQIAASRQRMLIASLLCLAIATACSPTDDGGLAGADYRRTARE